MSKCFSFEVLSILPMVFQCVKFENLKSDH